MGSASQPLQTWFQLGRVGCSQLSSDNCAASYTGRSQQHRSLNGLQVTRLLTYRGHFLHHLAPSSLGLGAFPAARCFSCSARPASSRQYSFPPPQILHRAPKAQALEVGRRPQISRGQRVHEFSREGARMLLANMAAAALRSARLMAWGERLRRGVAARPVAASLAGVALAGVGVAWYHGLVNVAAPQGRPSILAQVGKALCAERPRAPPTPGLGPWGWGKVRAGRGRPDRIEQEPLQCPTPRTDVDKTKLVVMTEGVS